MSHFAFLRNISWKRSNETHQLCQQRCELLPSVLHKQGPFPSIWSEACWAWNAQRQWHTQYHCPFQECLLHAWEASCSLWFYLHSGALQGLHPGQHSSRQPQSEQGGTSGPLESPFGAPKARGWPGFWGLLGADPRGKPSTPARLIQAKQRTRTTMWKKRPTWLWWRLQDPCTFSRGPTGKMGFML